MRTAPHTTCDQPCILVVGAGLAGLGAAVTLAETGRNCLLLEREPEAGGLARSLELDGVTFDYGPHVLFKEQGPGAQLLLETLSNEPTLSRRFAFAIQAGGRHWTFPNHFDVLRYPWRFQREILAGLLAPRKPREAGNDTAHNELSAKTGPGLYDLLFKGMNEGLRRTQRGVHPAPHDRDAALSDRCAELHGTVEKRGHNRDANQPRARA